VTTVLTIGLAGLFLLGLISVLAGLVFFAWLRQLWRELRRTPTFSQIARRAAVAKPMLTYRDALRRAPGLATDLTLRLNRKALALEVISNKLGSEQRFRVEETTRRYLPDTLNAFQMALVGADAERRDRASKMLVEQLAQLESSLDSIAAGAGEDGIAALQANGAFIEEISRPPSDIMTSSKSTEEHGPSS
jgi:hypothetical protein